MPLPFVLPNFVLQGLPFLGAGALAYAGYVFISRITRRIDFTSKDRADQLTKQRTDKRENLADFGSKQHKIRLTFARFHIAVDGNEEVALWIARIGVGVALYLVMNILGLKGLVSLAGLIGGFMLTDGVVDATWSKTRAALEKDLPLFVTGVSSTIAVDQDPVATVISEVEALEEQSPLRQWMRSRFLPAVQSDGARALPGLIDEANGISPSLSLVLFQLERFWQTGGTSGWAKAFNSAAENIETQIGQSIRAQATGDSYRGSIKIVTAVAAIVIVSMSRNPAFSDAISTPLVQLIYAGAILLMFFGWKFMNKLIDEAIQ